MRLTFAPALPLGMAGAREMMEFLSNRDISPDEFIPRVNFALPPGIKVLGMEKRESLNRTLSKEIEAFLYSTKCSGSELDNVFRRWELKKEPADAAVNQEKSMGSELEMPGLMEDDLLWADRESKKIFLLLSFRQERRARPQEIFERILNIKNSVFRITREKILLKSGIG